MRPTIGVHNALLRIKAHARGSDLMKAILCLPKHMLDAGLISGFSEFQMTQS